MLNKFLLNVLAIISVTTALVGCSDNDDTKLSQNARLTVRLTDAPGDYEAVNIDVQGVMVNASDDPESGWEEMQDVNTGIYDLLELTGGLNVLLADNQWPAGELKQIRLVLGENNTVVVDGNEMPLETPSAMQSGLKVKVNETLEAGYTYDIILDFDVDASIVEAGNSGNKNLKPVIRASSVATSGIISGSVEPSGFQTKVSVMVGEEEVSAYTDETGNFMLYGVPAGTYDVLVTPDPEVRYGSATIEGVTVVNGETTQLDPVVLVMLENVGDVTGTVSNEGLSFSATTVVTVEGVENSVEAVYGAEGQFTFYNLPATGEGESYTITVAAEGYQSVEVTGVTVADNELTTLEAPIELMVE
ncbi:DUF4382 domain-containing protein [Robertkochia flava]|uniref:DUF4382 domain-containing protein n=1 Tax=Robertkochia flava TaxID=3447986 RepID=UPI001CC90DF1|nr:DUF4382 domain-containing protein [Robertkochia marina]